MSKNLRKEEKSLLKRLQEIHLEEYVNAHSELDSEIALYKYTWSTNLLKFRRPRKVA